jgi:hypothetical protein
MLCPSTPAAAFSTVRLDKTVLAIRDGSRTPASSEALVTRLLSSLKPEQELAGQLARRWWDCCVYNKALLGSGRDRVSSFCRMILGFGLPQNSGIRVSVLPDSEKFQVSLPGSCGIARSRVRARHAKLRQRGSREVRDDAIVLEHLLKLRQGGVCFPLFEKGEAS